MGKVYDEESQRNWDANLLCEILDVRHSLEPLDSGNVHRAETHRVLGHHPGKFPGEISPIMNSVLWMENTENSTEVIRRLCIPMARYASNIRTIDLFRIRILFRFRWSYSWINAFLWDKSPFPRQFSIYGLRKLWMPFRNIENSLSMNFLDRCSWMANWTPFLVSRMD
jgi:hypothetical protein